MNLRIAWKKAAVIAEVSVVLKYTTASATWLDSTQSRACLRRILTNTDIIHAGFKEDEMYRLIGIFCCHAELPRGIAKR